MAMTAIEIRQAVDSLGIEVRESGHELKLHHCPYCEAGGTRAPFAHFSINADSGLWKCLRGSCEEKGNIYRLLRDHGRIELVTKARPAVYKRPVERPELTKNTDTFYRWYTEARGISTEILGRYGVGGYHDGKQWVIVYSFRDRAGRLVNHKYRTADKARQWQEKDAEPSFYGAQFLDPARGPLVIVEGEDDCHALAQIGIDNIVSVPSGTGSVYVPSMHAISQEFSDVVLLVDNDPPGQEYARKLAEKIGLAKVRNGLLPYKDGRECLLNGIDIFGIQKVITRAEHFRCDEVIKAGALRDEFLAYLTGDDQATGRHLSIPEIDKILGGIRLGELTVVTGHTGSGKSTFAYNLAIWCEQAGLNSMVMSFELPLRSVLRKVIEIITGEAIYIYDPLAEKWIKNKTPEWCLEELDKLNERDIWFLNRQTVETRGYYDLNKVETAIEYAVKFYDVKFIVIDHLHYFLKLSDARNPVHIIDEAVRQLKILTERLNVHIALLVHPNKTEDSRTGALVKLGLNSSKGASSIVQEADTFLVVSRSTKEEHPEARIEVLKNRGNGGRAGEIVFNVEANRNTYTSPLKAKREFTSHYASDK